MGLRSYNNVPPPQVHRGPRRQNYPPLPEALPDIFRMLVESGDLQLPIPKPNAPNTNMSKYCAYHQKNGHTLEECFVLKDKIYDLNDRGEIMWPALRDRLREVLAGQHKLQIH